MFTYPNARELFQNYFEFSRDNRIRHNVFDVYGDESARAQTIALVERLVQSSDDPVYLYQCGEFSTFSTVADYVAITSHMGSMLFSLGLYRHLERYAGIASKDHNRREAYLAMDYRAKGAVIGLAAGENEIINDPVEVLAMADIESDAMFHRAHYFYRGPSVAYLALTERGINRAYRQLNALYVYLGNLARNRHAPLNGEVLNLRKRLEEFNKLSSKNGYTKMAEQNEQAIEVLSYLETRLPCLIVLPNKPI